MLTTAQDRWSALKSGRPSGVPKSASQSNLVPEPGARVFVWGGWALMTLAALGFVHRYGAANAPIADDWFNVPVITGEQPCSADWLWSAYRGHRMPLPRLILVGASRLPGLEFRLGMFV